MSTLLKDPDITRYLDKPDRANSRLRSLLTLAILIPLLLNILILIGETVGLYSLGVALCLLTLSSVLVFAVLIGERSRIADQNSGCLDASKLAGTSLFANKIGRAHV